jgi:hypothetical protein
MGITVNSGNRTTPAPNSEVHLPDNRNVRNFEYFDKIRKDNPKLYFSAENQTEMLREAKKQGAAFYQR